MFLRKLRLTVNPRSPAADRQCMAHLGGTGRWGTRLLAAVAVPLLGLGALGCAYVGLFAHDRCAFNDSGRLCDPGPWVGRELAHVGGLAGAVALLILAYCAARVAAGRTSQRGNAFAVRAVAVCLAFCATGILLLRSTPA